MDRGQIPRARLAPNSDIDDMDIDQVLIVPDTPDRVSTEGKNICNGTSMSASSNSRNYGLAERGVFGRRLEVHSPSFGGSTDIGPTEGAGNHVVPSSLLGDATMSRMETSKTLKQQDNDSFNNHHSEGEKFSHFRFLGQSYNHRTLSLEHGGLESSSITTVNGSSKSTRNENKDKLRIGNDRPAHCVTRGEKRNDGICSIDPERNTGKVLSVPSQSVRLPSMASRKRLVRNGCISPHNITKAKQLAGGSVNVCADAGDNALSGGSDDVAKDDASTRAKGKAVVIPACSSNGHEDRRAGLFSELWRKGKLQETESIFGEDDCGNSSIMGRCSSSFASAASDPVAVLNEGQVCIPTTTIKKQKNHVSVLSSPERSTGAIYLSSCGESSAEKSTKDRSDHSQRGVGSRSPIAVGELSSEVRESNPETEARAIQVQLDEMLARELQEQLYNEMLGPATGGESARGRASARPRGRHHEYRAGAVPATNITRQPQSGSFDNRVNRRGTHSWFPTPSIARLRNRINRGSSLISSEDREMVFPADMDLDMRMELLEALEAVFNDDISMVNQLVDSDREFDENDYEMLLALDENNHEHLGASAAQIANLPESTVHTDSFEACSICLETPVTGDTIRHLPCLHKFHKGCIDPWLRRKRCCPICKSDI